MECGKAGVAGLGLIGASVAQGLASGFAEEVVGHDPDEKARAAWPGPCTQDFDELKGCDLLVLAAPPHALPGLIEKIDAWGDSATVVTDVASVKGLVANVVPPRLRPRFVPGHPMAGGETSGPTAARPDLFHGADWVLCPFPEASESAVALVRAMVSHLRALPTFMDAEDHDRHVALLSHAPHVLASALLLCGEGLPHRRIGGTSWRDLTRVGGANPALWADILTANKGAVMAQIDALSAQVSDFRTAIEDDDRPALEALFERARDAK